MKLTIEVDVASAVTEAVFEKGHEMAAGIENLDDKARSDLRLKLVGAMSKIMEEWVDDDGYVTLGFDVSTSRHPNDIVPVAIVRSR